MFHNARHFGSHLHLLISPSFFVWSGATLILLVSASLASAQQFTRLTSTSSYACIKFPSGKFGVGKAAKGGYATRSFAVASKEISTRLSEKRTQLRTKQELLRDFAKDNELTKTQLMNISDAQLSPGVPANVVAKVLKLNAAIAKVSGDISLINVELTALKDCQRGKTDFSTVTPAKVADVLAVNSTQLVLSSLLEVPYPGNYAADFKAFFCIKRDGQSSYRLAAGHKNPCSESNLGGVFEACPAAKGTLLIPLVLTYLSATASELLKTGAQSDIDREYAGNYTIQGISSNPNSPCGYLN